MIIKDSSVGTVMTTLTREEQIINNANRTRYVLSLDSTTVLNILKECTHDTYANTWIKNIRCGMLAMQALQDHYD